MSQSTHRANYGFLTSTSGAAKDCIRSLCEKGVIVQRVVLASSVPAIRIKPSPVTKSLGEPKIVTRGEDRFAEVEINGCAVYWEVKEH